MKEFKNYTNYSKIINQDFIEFFQGQRILISGASGLLGMHFAQLFQTFNCDFDGQTEITVISKTGIFPFELDNKVQIIQQDLTESSLPSSLGTFDSIIHGAGYGQPSKFLNERLKTIHLNTSTTMELSKLAHPEGSFLFISTSELYSGLANPPFRESQIGTSNTNHPRSSYIESKRTGEAIISAVKSEFPSMVASCARLALAYGPGTKPGDSRVLYELISKGLTDREIVLRDAGNAIRTYCFVSDAIEQCIAILMKANDHVYNVGGKSRLTVAELAIQIGQIMEVPVRIPKDSEQFLTDAPQEVWLDLTEIEELSGKKTYVDMKDGLEQTISWIKNGPNRLGN
jgi:nucleoside-diphosphate-sugar epimerase